MGLFWNLYTAVSDDFPGIWISYGCSCRLNAISTALVLEFLDLMNLASIAFSINGHPSFSVFLIRH